MTTQLAEEVQHTPEEVALRYLILTDISPDKLSIAVSALMAEQWEPHGDLKLQIMADESSLTFARVIYIQAMKRGAANA